LKIAGRTAIAAESREKQKSTKEELLTTKFARNGRKVLGEWRFISKAAKLGSWLDRRFMMFRFD